MPFARELNRHGDRIALVAQDGSEITYRELALRVSLMMHRLGAERRLVLVSASNDIEPLVTYLAALAGGHPVLLTAAGDYGHVDRLISTYDPDVVSRGAGDQWLLHERRAGTAHELHPELALLLSTSGSTGSPKLVRLSAANLQANAAAIADYLAIRDTDRAVTSLPMHYCYGLSVINSNLLTGAGLLLTNDSVVSDGFWTTFRAHRGTSLHGVPYTFDLLDSLGFERMDLPSLRYVTQAGGRLAPERVQRFAAVAEVRRWRLFVMYGQTEATARMAYLPPELAASHPSAVGIPIPGGSFEIRASDDMADDGGDSEVGELIYRGPNVMLGYAESPADLALGRTIDELATGDLARQMPDGLYEVVGRKSRFVKLFGLRVDLNEVERLLQDNGHHAACTGTDEALIVAVSQGEDTGTVVELVQIHLGIPASSVRTCEFDELPRLATGKIDYATIGQRADHDACPRPGPRQREASTRDSQASIRQVFARVLNSPDPDDAASFVSLGGDSMSYVRMSIELEKVLGRVPEGWHTMTVAELEHCEPRRGMFRAMETDIVLRAVAIVLIVGSHVGLFTILGGAHLLLVISGWCFARFGLARVEGDSPGGRILRSATRIAVPAIAWLIYRMAVTQDVGWPNIFLINNFLQTSSAIGYWFIEVLVQVLVVLAIVFAIPAVRRIEARHGFTVAAIALVLALIARLGIDDTSEFPERAMSTQGVMWFFVLGWIAQRSATTVQKVLVVGVAVVIMPGFFGDPVREGIVAGGLLLLLLLPQITVPRLVVPVVGLIAGASLYIYLTHYAVYPSLLVRLALPAVVVALISLAVGIGAWLLVERLTRLTGRLVRAHEMRRPAPQSGPLSTPPSGGSQLAQEGDSAVAFDETPP
ncbi:MAG: AMP-binding protein [Pseudonocardiaceae bacterium]